MKLAGIVEQYLARLRRENEPLRRKLMLDLFGEQKDAMILDVGCGDGDLSRAVADKVGTANIFGMEIVKPFVETARGVNGIDVTEADASGPFPHKDDTFDIVLANQVIEHVYDTDNFVREIRRVLRPGGYCVVSTTNLASPHNVLSLMLGFQPPPAHISDEVFCGNPLLPGDQQPYPEPRFPRHRRLFTMRALKGLLQFHGLRYRSKTGWGLHPLPLFNTRWFRFTPYAVMIAVTAEKDVS